MPTKRIIWSARASDLAVVRTDEADAGSFDQTLDAVATVGAASGTAWGVQAVIGDLIQNSLQILGEGLKSIGFEQAQILAFRARFEVSNHKK